MKKAIEHTVLKSDTLACLHCGQTYRMTFPAPLEILSATAKAFEKLHARCKVEPGGLRCTLCFGSGHQESTCPATRYGGDPRKWFYGPDTGTSSKVIWHVMMGQAASVKRGDHPLDPSDFGRCFRLLEAFPAWRERIGEMVAISRVWARMAEHWGELEALYREEVPKHTGNAPKLYARMQELRRGE